jgi:Rrf2 family iron-sulfur cluster assembly transcriptional regulator
MIDIALRQTAGPVPLADVASRQHVSLTYLEQLFSKLRARGLVTSIRGPGGGYLIAKQNDGITVSDILGAVEESGTAAQHPGASTVQEVTQALWEAMNATVRAFTHSVTLDSLVSDELARGAEIEPARVPKRGVFQKPVHLAIHADVPNSVFELGRISQTHG